MDARPLITIAEGEKNVDDSEALECLLPIINPSKPLARHV